MSFDVSFYTKPDGTSPIEIVSFDVFVERSSNNRNPFFDLEYATEQQIGLEQAVDFYSLLREDDWRARSVGSIIAILKYTNEKVYAKLA